MDRRKFVRNTSASIASLTLPNLILKQDVQKIKIGVIGTGWWGRDILISSGIQSGRVEVIGICDVSQAALQLALTRLEELGQSKPASFQDYRELLEMQGLDAVVITTPPHWHALQFIAACEKGLDVWLEKPISYDIAEAKAMKAAHEKAGNVVLVDFPRLYSPVNDEVRKILNADDGGEIVQVHFNINNPTGYPPVMDVPDTIDYKAFCGPVAEVPYRAWPNAIVPAWRSVHAFGRGTLADWGIHFLQNIRTVLDLDMPKSITAFGSTLIPGGREIPDQLSVQFKFGDLAVNWDEKSFGYVHPTPNHNIGVFYVTTNATIFAMDTGIEVYNKNGVQTYGQPTLKQGGPEYMKMVFETFSGMFNEFSDAVIAKDPSAITATFDDGYKSTCATIFSDLAYRTKRPLNIDPANMSVLDNPEASKLTLREYQNGYKHPGIG